MNSPESEKYVWILTRDQSPTLWSHSYGEAYRSVRGAFTESWTVFVKPALEYILSEKHDDAEITIGEFGLGAGTNWFFWNLATQALGIPSHFVAIEKDTEAFEIALQKWNSIQTETLERIQSDLKTIAENHNCELNSNTPFHFERPLIFGSLDQLLESQDFHQSCQIWFHDPFGFDVNPEGYSVETLKKCSQLWNPQGCWGGSFACNKRFQESLSQVEGCTPRVALSGHEILKRDRLEFRFKK